MRGICLHTTIFGIIDCHAEVLQRAGIIGRGKRGCQSQEGNEEVDSFHFASQYTFTDAVHIVA